MDSMSKKKEFEGIPETSSEDKLKKEKALVDPETSKEIESKKSFKNKLIDVMNYLKSGYEFRYNLFVQKTEYAIKKLGNYYFFDERAYDNIRNEVLFNTGHKIGKDDFSSLLGSSYMAKDYNPIKQYLFALPEWDGVDHFTEFLKRVQLKDESLRNNFIHVFKKWFTNYIGALVSDPVYNENCLVLVGKQAAGKTRFLMSLIPGYLQLYYTFSGNFDARDKDHIEMLGTKLIIILDEMATLTRTEVETMKNIMSQKVINVRRAYGRAPIHLMRSASFCGSLNDDEFLTDQTGNRRWLPFAVYEIDNSTEYNLEQLYAQGLHLFKSGFRYYFELHEIRELEKHNETFRRIPMEEEMLHVNFRVPTPAEITNGYGIKYMTTTDVVHFLANKDEYRKMTVNDTVLKRMGKSLIKLGYTKAVRRIDDNKPPVKVWTLCVFDKTDADAMKKGGNLDENDERLI